MKRLKTLLVVALCAASLAACSTLPANGPVTGQHPAWAMNPTTCALVGTVLPPLLGIAVPGLGVAAQSATAATYGAILSVGACQMEASLVNGQPAQVTQTTTTVQGVTKTN